MSSYSLLKLDPPVAKSKSYWHILDHFLLTLYSSPGDSFNKYLEDLVTKEMDKQENALDFSRNSGLEKQARVYGYYLFNSSDQAPKTRERWMKEAMKRVNKMQVADIRANGVGPAVKEALTSAVEGELRGQVTDFTISTKAIINMIKEME